MITGSTHGACSPWFCERLSVGQCLLNNIGIISGKRTHFQPEKGPTPACAQNLHGNCQTPSFEHVDRVPQATPRVTLVVASRKGGCCQKPDLGTRVGGPLPSPHRLPTPLLSSYRLTIGNKTCVFEKENDPTILRAPSAGKLMQYTVEDGGHVEAGGSFAEIEVGARLALGVGCSQASLTPAS